MVGQKPFDLLFGKIGKHGAPGKFIVCIHRHSPFHLNRTVEQVIHCKILPFNTSQVELHRQDSHAGNAIVYSF